MPVFQRDSFSTYFEDNGSGDALVLVCGLSADLQVWRFQVAELSKTFRVICYDNRGAGRSAAPDEPYTIGQMAGDLAALLDHLNVRKARILGWSMGGVIAQSYALARPDRVEQLLLLGTFPAPDGYLHAAISNWVNMRRSNMPYEHTVRHLARMVYSPALAKNPKAYEAFIQVMLSNPYRQTDHGFFRQAEALLSYKQPPNLGQITIRTVVLVGEHDQLTPKYMSEELAAVIPGSTLQVLPGAHSGFIEYPDQYNRKLLDILSAAEM